MQDLTPAISFVHLVIYSLLWSFAFLSFYHALGLIPGKRRRWHMYVFPERRDRKWTQNIFLVGLNAKAARKYEELLNGCGIRVSTEKYLLYKRWAVCLTVLAAAGTYMAYRHLLLDRITAVLMLCLTLTVLIMLMFDQTILHWVKRKREAKIVEEIYAVSKQLLFYSQSKMNLHSKLSKCVPYTQTIRSDLLLLLHEWYEDADQAVNRFKRRLAVSEAYSFAETLNSLRLDENEDYYALLRQRMQDYKEKIELGRESKKESMSYVLYVLAGIPILNTFRVFVYPWIEEGKKLFDALS